MSEEELGFDFSESLPMVDPGSETSAVGILQRGRLVVVGSEQGSPSVLEGVVVLGSVQAHKYLSRALFGRIAARQGETAGPEAAEIHPKQPSGFRCLARNEEDRASDAELGRGPRRARAVDLDGFDEVSRDEAEISDASDLVVQLDPSEVNGRLGGGCAAQARRGGTAETAQLAHLDPRG